MRLRDVLIRSAWRSRRRYAGYVLASSVAVATFVSFCSFLLHPDLNTDDVPNFVLQLLILGQIGTTLFGIFFVRFFHRFLLRLRGREFGLLVMMGMAPRQIRRMVWIESLALASGAILLGLLLSVAETWTLFLVIGRIVVVAPLSLTLTPAAIAIGVDFFAIVFVTDAYFSAREVQRVTPRMLLASSRRTQTAPKVSLGRVLVGVGCLMVAYALALVFSANETVGNLTVMPIALLCAVGTYILFSQVMVLVLSRVRRSTESGLTLLVTGRLAHRVRDYAAILTVVTVLSAGVMTLLSVGFGSLMYLRETAKDQADYDEIVQVLYTFLFVSFFLSFLCFIAAASTLYVKLFTQIDEDRTQFRALRRIGLLRDEIGRIVTRELGVLFFAPVLIAIVHSAVAMGEVTINILPDGSGSAVRSAWLAYAGVVALYDACFAVYYVLARRSYASQSMVSGRV